MSSQAHTPSRSSFPVVVAAIGLLLLFWFLTSKIYVDQPEPVLPAAVERPSLEEHRGEAATALQSYGVVDAGSGKVRLPIERAKELVIAERSRSIQ